MLYFLLLSFIQADSSRSERTLKELLTTFNVPVIGSIIIFLALLGLTFIFFRYIFIPMKREHYFEKQEIELKNSRLMALFAELAPDPIIRINEEGEVTFTNKAARQVFDQVNFDEKVMIADILDIGGLSIAESIANNQTANFNKSLGERHFSVNYKGIGDLNIGQFYFHDITERKKHQDELLIYQKNLRKLSTHLRKSIDDERYRIAGELHDGIGQNLYFIRLGLKNYPKKIPELNTLSDYEDNIELLEKTIGELREITYDLRPRLLQESGMQPAVTAMVDKVNSEGSIKGSCDFFNMNARFDKELELALFRIIQESINNIVKHSGAKEFDIQMLRDEAAIRVFINDNGKGFEPRKIAEGKYLSSGIGLMNMQERIESFGGSMEIDSTPGNGTTIILEAPCKEEITENA